MLEGNRTCVAFVFRTCVSFKNVLVKAYRNLREHKTHNAVHVVSEGWGRQGELPGIGKHRGWEARPMATCSPTAHKNL